MKGLKKTIYIIIGTLSMVAGAVGIVLPLLPTTPLLLLTAYCYARGSDRFHAWFTGTRLYKRYLENFVRDRSMPLLTRILLPSAVSAMLLIVIISFDITALRIVAGLLMAVKWYYFIFRIKTQKRPGSESPVQNSGSMHADACVLPAKIATGKAAE